jgi:hypothetical protein
MAMQGFPRLRVPMTQQKAQEPLPMEFVAIEDIDDDYGDEVEIMLPVQSRPAPMEVSEWIASAEMIQDDDGDDEELMLPLHPVIADEPFEAEDFGDDDAPIITKPLQPAVQRPPPLYVPPAMPGVLPVRPPFGGGLVATRVAPTAPRPSFLKPVAVDDFPAPYEEPPEHILSGPIAAHKKPPPLYAQRTVPVAIPVVPPGNGGIMINRTRPMPPRPSFLKPISEN